MALTARGKKVEALLDNPNIRAFLDIISAAEGTSSAGYHTGFDGDRQGHLETLDDHPRYRRRFKRRDGKGSASSAAGRYQLLEGTWDEEAKKLGLTDFSERSQDMAAISRLMFRGVIDDILAGDLKKAAMSESAGKEWASLPSAPASYSQPKRSGDWLDRQVAAARAIPSIVPPVPDIRPNIRPEAPQMSALQELAQAVQPPQVLPGIAPLPPEEAAPDGAPAWADALLASSIQRDADGARSRAVAAFAGREDAPQIHLPKALERSINKILASL